MIGENVFSGEDVLICADTQGTQMLGLVQSINISQSRRSRTEVGLGSERKTDFPEHCYYQCSLSRVIFMPIVDEFPKRDFLIPLKKNKSLFSLYLFDSRKEIPVPLLTLRDCLIMQGQFGADAEGAAFRESILLNVHDIEFPEELQEEQDEVEEAQRQEREPRKYPEGMHDFMRGGTEEFYESDTPKNLFY